MDSQNLDKPDCFFIEHLNQLILISVSVPKYSWTFFDVFRLNECLLMCTWVPLKVLSQDYMTGKFYVRSVEISTPWIYV